MTIRTDYIGCIVDGSHGIYTGMVFAGLVVPAEWTGIDPESLAILKVGPDHGGYIEAWIDVSDNAETVDGGVLILGESGDVFLCDRQAAIDDFDAMVADQLEYEESHEDAGNNYAFLVAESWGFDGDNRLAESLADHKIDAMGLDSDTLADIALDLFTMESGHIFSNMSASKIVLDSFSVGEIEVTIPDQFADVIEYIENDVDSYVDGTQEYAYVSSDSVWYAVIEPDAMQAAICDYVADQ